MILGPEPVTVTALARGRGIEGQLRRRLAAEYERAGAAFEATAQLADSPLRSNRGTGAPLLLQALVIERGDELLDQFGKAAASRARPHRAARR